MTHAFLRAAIRTPIEALTARNSRLDPENAEEAFLPLGVSGARLASAVPLGPRPPSGRRAVFRPRVGDGRVVSRAPERV